MALYPPIVASSMPAFDINNQDGVKIYFTLPNYTGNKKEEIKKIHVTVRNQASNVNVVNNTSNILVKQMQQDQLDKIYNRYYINITSSDLTQNNFSVDKLYKVQLRFSSVTSTKLNASFFSDNLDKFSQWSTVCIIKPINPPQFYIDEFKQDNGTGEQDIVNDFNYAFAQFTGIFNAGESSQVLKSWRLRLYNSNFNIENINSVEPLKDSKEQLSSAYNYTLDQTGIVLQCLLDYELQQNQQYVLLFSIKTKNDYQAYKIYKFNYQSVAINPLSGSLNTKVNEEEGYIKVTYITSLDDLDYTGNVVLRRSDSHHNFLNWKDLKNFELYSGEKASYTEDDKKTYQYYDFTAESGVAYKYIIQKRDSRGRRGFPLYDQTGTNKNAGTMGEWEYALLLQSAGNGDYTQARQLKLKYDFQISSYKTNVSESKTDTIGSKYPFIRRNGSMYYRSFPITGTITAYMDNVNLFTSKEKLNDNVSIYEKYRGDYSYFNVDEVPSQRKYDYTYERKFRQVVEEFLYNSKPKLYKSMQEGNILIKLMEVSLTPKNQLGRLIYTFSATAYEIGQPSLANLNAYGFINIGTYNPAVSYTVSKIGQLLSFNGGDLSKGQVFKAGKDIIGAGTDPAANSVASKNNYQKPYNGQILTDFKINYLRIEVQSPPYLIIQENGKLRVYDDIDDNTIDTVDFENPYSKFYQLQSTYYNTKTSTNNTSNVNMYLGTLFELNGQQIMIAYPNTIYELKDDDLELPANSTLIPAKDTIMSFDYTINLHYQEDTTKTPKRSKSSIKVGQIIGNYNNSQQLVDIIKLKYIYKYYKDPKNLKQLVQQSVRGITAISIDTNPGTVLYVGTVDVAGNKGFANRFVVNQTGELNLDLQDSSVYINTYRIYGKNFLLNELNDRSSQSSGSLNNISFPKTKDYCEIENKFYIYYKGAWYQANKVNNQSFDIQCNVDAMLFYTIHIKEDSF